MKITLSTRSAQKHFKAPQIKGRNLVYMKSNFECLPMAIISLQKQGIALLEAIQIVQNISAKFNDLKSQTETMINQKLQTVFFLIEGFQIVYNTSKLLKGEKKGMQLKCIRSINKT